MDASTKSQLARIEAQLNQNLATLAMDSLSNVLRRLPYEELALAKPDVEALINRFFPKRQRELRRILVERLEGAKRHSLAESFSDKPSTAPRSADNALGQRVIGEEQDPKRLEYSVRLNELRSRHIFQWSTAYRETITYMFKELRLALSAPGPEDAQLKTLSSLLEKHSTDIFQRGYDYITSTMSAATDVAVAKSISGLQRFLFLVIDAHSSAASDLRSKEDAVVIRAVASAMLCGILRGYGPVRLGPAVGWALLREYPTQWAHAMAFMTSTDLTSLLQSAPDNDLRTDLMELVVPSQLAIDRVIQALPPQASALPRVGKFGQYPPRFEVTLASSASTGRTSVRLTTFLGSPQREPSLIQEALAGGATAVVARIDNSLWQAEEHAWNAKVIDATKVGTLDDLVDNIAERVAGIVGAAFANVRLYGAEPLAMSQNYASEFPLKDPIVRQFYLVQRHSVRQLLDTFVEGTGPHVWCSVRRSGKTTATIELSGDTSRSVVITQTMDQQPNQPDLNIFYKRIVNALEAGKPIQASFFQAAVDDCSLASSPVHLINARRVFIIDEYETLFGLLNAKAQQDDWVRYSVVQPLLSQMVAFSTSNLLVFLGQRPDAHAILMSQNQLSPLVRQDSFPLFEHINGSTTSEFARFLEKVLSGLGMSAGFIDSVYEETSGHPYLTVNLMIDFCDWLIASHRRTSGLRLEPADMDGFTRDRLNTAVLQRSAFYSTFQQMIADSLSEAIRAKEPWLHAVTLVIQQICKKHQRALSCSEPRYREIASDTARSINLSPGQLLQGATMANFLASQGGQVRPAIRIFGRLAAVAVVEVN